MKQALHDLRQRRAVRIIDLRKSNKRSIDEVDPEISDLDYTPTDTEASPLTMSSPAAPMVLNLETAWSHLRPV